MLDQSDPTKSEVSIVVTDLNGTVTYADYSVTLPDTFDPVAQTFDLLSEELWAMVRTMSISACVSPRPSPTHRW